MSNADRRKDKKREDYEMTPAPLQDCMIVSLGWQFDVPLAEIRMHLRAPLHSRVGAGAHRDSDLRLRANRSVVDSDAGNSQH